ncbi:hypothetical protein TgHK011_005546 [Trichoderma gracile]|nr:hypothetical protein TgHK011_005546 [Trichoderma gracile]
MEDGSMDLHRPKRRRSSPLNHQNGNGPKRNRLAIADLLDLNIDDEDPVQTTPGTSEPKYPDRAISHTIPGLDICNDTGEQIVCFGMIDNICGVCQLARPATSRSFPVTLKDSQSFISSWNASTKGLIDPGSTYITAALLDEQDLELEIVCSMKASKPSTARSALPCSAPCRLSVTIFGPLNLLEEIGSFFEDHELYLQDPMSCSRDVLYRNPHKLSDESGSVVWTSDIAKEHAKCHIIDSTQPRPELIDVLNTQEDLVEAKQPGSIRSVMKSHQLQALTFMLQREQGWAWDGSRPDLWEFCSESTGSCFVNRVSGAAQAEQPQQFYGGMIADSMGLGKTLSMISLIASDLLVNKNDPNSIIGANSEESSGRTLIVVPPPLLDSWEEQLKQHVFSNSIPWRRHHGKSRLADETDLAACLVVLTTYHTVSSDWRSNSDQQHSFLFNTRWRRIILDEAHFIRNSDSRMARAICSLDSVSRWAVTGTPIQNRLGDLTALLKFLQVYPYSEEHMFNADISHLWKVGRIEEAVKRLKRLAGCILLRRPKTVIQLPPRHDLTQFLELAPAERNLYQNYKSHAISHIEHTLSVDGKFTRTYSYANMLQRIEAMRMICNLGVYYQPHDVKCVVFSSWRTTLEIIELGLKQAGIPCLRYDGKVAQKDRHEVVERFRKDPTIRVLLLTISCGAVGLTLTEASRAYLMEPHWNPTIEDQALARIHRIGQTKEVTTIRYIVKDTFEERVVELQQSKTDLAEVIHRQSESSQSAEPRRPLEWLKTLI